ELVGDVDDAPPCRRGGRRSRLGVEAGAPRMRRADLCTLKRLRTVQVFEGVSRHDRTRGRESLGECHRRRHRQHHRGPRPEQGGGRVDRAHRFARTVEPDEDLLHVVRLPQLWAAGLAVASRRNGRPSSPTRRRSSNANTICTTPLTNANAATSASRATAPAPGFANMITPNAVERTPLSPSSSERRPRIGRLKADAISKTPLAIAQAAIAYSSPSADKPGQMKTTTPTAIPSKPSHTSHVRRFVGIGTVKAPPIVVSPETSAYAPKSASRAVRPMLGQTRMTRANAIATAPRTAIAFQMRASVRSPSCSWASRFISAPFRGGGRVVARGARRPRCGGCGLRRSPPRSAHGLPKLRRRRWPVAARGGCQSPAAPTRRFRRSSPSRRRGLRSPNVPRRRLAAGRSLARPPPAGPRSWTCATSNLLRD